MPTAYEVAKATVAASPVSYVRNGKSYCQTFAGNFWETHFGKKTPNSYATATAAYKASKIASMDPNTAPPGAYHYFEYGGQGGAGHVGVALGSGLMASGTGYGTNAIENLGKGVLIHRVSDYARHLKYLGWSYTNGARAQITGLTDHNATAGPGQRKVGDVEVRRRTAPKLTAAYDGNANLPPGHVADVSGWVLGDESKGTNVWFVIGGLYSHAGGFTNSATAGLNDLNVYPNERVVRADITNGRIRKDATTGSDQLGILDPGTKHTVKRFKKGEKVKSVGVTTDIWYEIGDGFGWAGSFTTQSTSGLEEILPVPPVSTPVRVVRSDNGVNVRSQPRSSAALVRSIDRSTAVLVTEYTIGDKVTSSSTGVSSDIWYVVEGGFAWAGGFTEQSIDRLKFHEVVEPEAPKWPSTGYSFSADFPAITSRVVPADWSNFENEYSQPDATKRVGFPTRPTAVVAHQWGAPGAYTVDSVLNTLKTRHETSAGRMAPHFVVTETEIIQTVSLAHRAYHAGAGGNDYVGIEIDPLMTPGVIENVKRLLLALRDRNDGVPLEIKYHKDLPGAATSCGLYTQPHESAFKVGPAPASGDLDELHAEVARISARLDALVGAVAEIAGKLDKAADALK